MSETLTCICDQGFGMNLSCPVHQLPAATVLLSGPSAEDERRPVDWEQFTTSERVAFVRGWRAALASRAPAGEPTMADYERAAGVFSGMAEDVCGPDWKERQAEYRAIAQRFQVASVAAPDERAPSDKGPIPYMHPACACGHAWGLHIPTLHGSTCTHTYDSETTTGVAGLRVTHRCKCVAYEPVDLSVGATP